MSDLVNPSPLAAALAQAQGRMGAAEKDRRGNFGAYATLASVLDAIRLPMSEAGIAYMQLPSFDGELVHVTTRLAHGSGDFIETTLSAKPTKTDPQGIGSAITYLRRYGLMAAVGVAPDDDDGQAASRPTSDAPEASRARSASPVASPRPASPAAPSPAPAVEPAATSPATTGEGGAAGGASDSRERRTVLLGALRELDVSLAEFVAWRTADGKESASSMHESHFRRLIEWLRTSAAVDWRDGHRDVDAAARRDAEDAREGGVM